MFFGTENVMSDNQLIFMCKLFFDQYEFDDSKRYMYCTSQFTRNAKVRDFKKD
jgi:hypothetical protein